MAGTPTLVCSFALGRGLYCAEPATKAHDHDKGKHQRAAHGTRIVCSCGDFNCASLDVERCTQCGLELRYCPHGKD